MIEICVRVVLLHQEKNPLSHTFLMLPIYFVVPYSPDYGHIPE